MFKKIFLLGLTMLSIVSCSEGDTADVTGRIAMKGSSIHTYLVIEDAQTHKALKINNYKVYHLERRQNEIVTLKVKLIKKAIGPGFPAEVEVVEVK
ncbi:MAG TPA: hypothetical protein ENK39_09550 [Epsilonproteobacteria bacterium]|nr:hypothetical protein [Campylobacterota bacterium]